MNSFPLVKTQRFPGKALIPTSSIFLPRGGHRILVRGGSEFFLKKKIINQVHKNHQFYSGHSAQTKFSAREAKNVVLPHRNNLE